MTTGEIIRRIRMADGVTQAKLARSLKVSRLHLAIETGADNPVCFGGSRGLQAAVAPAGALRTAISER